MYQESNWDFLPINNWQDTEKQITPPYSQRNNKKDHSQCCSSISALDDFNYEDDTTMVNPNDTKLTNSLNNFDEKSYHFLNGIDEMVPLKDDELDCIISIEDFSLHLQDKKNNSEHNYSINNNNTFDFDPFHQYDIGINSAASSQEILVKDDPMISAGLKYSQEITPAKYPTYDDDDDTNMENETTFSDFLTSSQREQTTNIDKCLWNEDENDKPTAVLIIGKNNNLPVINIKPEKNLDTFSNMNNINKNINDEQTIMLSDLIFLSSSTNKNINESNNKKINNKRKKSSDSSSSIETQSKKRKFELKKKKASLKIELPSTNQQNSSKYVQPHLSTPDICDEVLQLEEETLQNDNVTDMLSTQKQISQLIPDNSIPVIEISHDINSDQLTALGVKTYNRRSSRLSSSSSSVFKFENPPSVQSSCTTEDLYASSIAPATPSSWSSEVAQRKRRGRPPKAHSEMPDPNEMQQLDEAARRYREQRYKNNEASRQSRLNRKQKEQLEKQEEQLLQAKNDELQIEHDKCLRQVQKLQKLLCDELGKLRQERSL